jgi:hypothetical protein
MRFDLDDPAFQATIAQWLRVLDDDVLPDIARVFDESPGVYPTTLLALWVEELKRRGLKPRPTSAAGRNDEPENLPVEHALDSDWRFSKDSAIELAALALSVAREGDFIAHVGTPSTFLRCVLGSAGQRHVLLDRNVSVLDAFEARGVGPPHIMIGIDLRAVRRLRLQSAAAIVDPPWYLDDTLLFLGVAAEMCRLGARLILCQPTEGTRPGVAEERDALLAALPSLGLALDEVRSGAVRYVMPHFEALSLRTAVGDVQIPARWRRGDVLVLVRVGSVLRPQQRLREWQTWREATFGPVRIKLGERPTGEDLGELVTGDVMTTVSRRDPVREHIGLWTSGNRVFTLGSPEAIVKLISLCETDLMSGRFSLEPTMAHAELLGVDERVATKLFDLLQVEIREHCEGTSPNV